MGISCISRSTSTSTQHQQKKGEIKSNSLSSDTNEHIEVESVKKVPAELSFPRFDCRDEVGNNYQLSRGNSVFNFSLHRQFTYRELLPTLNSFNSLNDFAIVGSHPYLDQVSIQLSNSGQGNKLIRISQCCNLERDSWTQLGKRTFLDQTQSYVIVPQDQLFFMPNCFLNQSPIVSTIPDSIILLQLIEKRVMKIEYITQGQQDELLDKYATLHEEYKHHTIIKTASFSGMHFFDNICSLKPEMQGITEMLGIKHSGKGKSLVFIYQSMQYIYKPNPVSIDKLETYFEISNYVSYTYGSFWALRSNILVKTNRKQVYAYMALQLLRHRINIMEQYKKYEKNFPESSSLYTARLKIIGQFLSMTAESVRSIFILGNIALRFQQIPQKDIKKCIIKLLNSIHQNVDVIIDGIFIEFGLEINAIQHPLRKDRYHFLKRYHLHKHQNNPHLFSFANFLKKVVSIIPQLPVLMAEYLQKIRDPADIADQKLSELQEKFTVRFKSILQLNQSNNNSLSLNPFRSQEYFYQDYLIRLRLYHIFLTLVIEPKNAYNEWLSLSVQLQKLKYLSGEVALTALTVGAIMSSYCKQTFQASHSQEWYYRKCIQVTHRLYGDPRSNRLSSPPKQLKWQMLILDNFINYYSKLAGTQQYNYLLNIQECLKEDFKDSQTFAEAVADNQQLSWIIYAIPIQFSTGIFYLASDIWQSNDQESKSSNSDTGMGVTSRRNKKCYHLIDDFETSASLGSFCGLIRWGKNVNLSPSVFPALKNFEVLMIASGNYHTVIVTEQGIYGWGDAHAGQLGNHNKSNSIIQQAVLIKAVNINRHKDVFQVSCGNQHTAVLINGVLEMWGQEDTALLGGNSCLFDFVCCGGLHTIAIRDGFVYSWGRGEGGQLGHPVTMLKQKRKEETTEFYIDRPLKINGIKDAIKAVCGDAHSIVLTKDGQVYVFGFCYQGQLGLGLTGESEVFQIFQPVKLDVFAPARVIEVFVGPTFSFFKTDRKEIYSCGMNDCMQLGIDRMMKVFAKKKFLNRTQQTRKKVGQVEFSRPLRIDMFSDQVKLGINVMKIECGQNHCLAQVKYLDKQDMIMGWGLNKNYQIGSQFTEVTPPRTLDSLFGIKVTQICCGSTYSLANIGELGLSRGDVQNLLTEAIFDAQNALGSFQ